MDGRESMKHMVLIRGCQMVALFLREQRAKVRACTRPWRLPR